MFFALQSSTLKVSIGIARGIVDKKVKHAMAHN